MRMLCSGITITLVLTAAYQLAHAQPHFTEYLARVKSCVQAHKCLSYQHLFDYRTLAQIIRAIGEHVTPDECKCDLTIEACVRRCYYTLSVDVKSILGYSAQWMERFYASEKFCILENKKCEKNHGLNITDIRHDLANYITFFHLPEECQCNLNLEFCVRPCYYSLIERSSKTLSNRQAYDVVMLIDTAIDDPPD